MKRGKSTCPAFTLVELLVVLGIIALLVALLLPATAAARRQVQQLHCQSNLRQIGLGMTTYTQQYKSFPVAWVYLSPVRIVQCWPVRVRAFLDGSQRVFYCPAQDERCRWTADAPGSLAFASELHTRFGYTLGERLIVGVDETVPGTQDGMYFSYGTNSLGAVPSYPPRRGVGGVAYDRLGQATQIDSRRLPEVRSPSQFILVADTVADGEGDTQVFPRNYASAGHDNTPATVHRGGSNVLFCDGHVEWFLKRDLVIQWPLVPEEGAKQRLWNIDHLPALP